MVDIHFNSFKVNGHVQSPRTHAWCKKLHKKAAIGTALSCFAPRPSYTRPSYNGALMNRILSFFSLFRGRFSVFKKHPPIVEAEGFGDFLAARASFIAQKSLYGYLKTRMGIAYPNMFQDEVFVQSMNIAKWNIYAACLSDLAIFMAANVFVGKSDKSKVMELAKYWHHKVVRQRFGEADDFNGDLKMFLKDFEKRIKTVNWDEASIGEGAFKESPPALIRWAPIDPGYKKYDEPLVLNSIRFAWQAQRREYVKLLDRQRFLADWESYRKEAKLVEKS